MESSLAGGVLAFIIFLTSFKGFRDGPFLEHYLFEVDPILIDRQYYRLFSSGFLHGGWFHLFFNLIALLSFSVELEFLFGIGRYLFIYFGSLLGGSLLSLYIHRNHGDYRALGASGAISGLIFSSVILFPEGSISFIILPFEIKSWIFGLAFVVISILGIKHQIGNIGHDAHLGGAITGVLLTMAIEPSVVKMHPWVIAGILMPAILFLVLIVRNPTVLLIDQYWGDNVESIKKTVSRRPERRLSPQEELDELLEKIQRKGIGSLSDQERRRLDELSKKR